MFVFLSPLTMDVEDGRMLEERAKIAKNDAYGGI